MYKYNNMDVNNYVSKKEALQHLGVSSMTLIKMANTNQIEYIKTQGGHRKYNISKYIRDNKINIAEEQKEEDVENEKINISYIRVSTLGQKSDLERQRSYMLNKYPTHEIIEDIGSGINFNRKGLRKIIKMAIEGKINELVVAYRDRLTRFGFDLIEDLIITYSKGKIIIETEHEEREPKEELVDDVLQILNVYTAKLNGLRKYTKKSNM